MLQNWAGLVCLCQTLAFALSTQTVSNIPVDNPDNPFLVKSDIPHKVNKRLKDNNLSSGCPGRTTWNRWKNKDRKVTGLLIISLLGFTMTSV